MTVTEQALAKLNLTLEIGQKRPDGYHELISVMTCATLCDTITLETSDDGKITLTCDDPTLACDERNLAYRAAQAFFGADDCPGVHLHLQKRIPMQAGLGGGSSDAAAVLRGLQRLYRTDKPLETLGATLGSDVPFCVRGGTARCWGRGEQMARVENMPKCWYVIVKPPEAHPTGAMYAAIDAQQPPRRHTTDALLAALARGDLTGIADNLYNTFEAVLPADSAIFTIREALLHGGALNAMMSGSGSAVFGIFADGQTAQRAQEALQKTWEKTFLAESV